MSQTVNISQPAGVRQLLIGLDAMEWSLVERWADEGKLPTFKRLMDTGLRAELSGTAECLADTTWPAICCGVNPAKLGKYFYVEYDAKTAALRYTPDQSIKATPMWNYLAEAGRSVGVVDVPHFAFADLPGGFRVVNWGAHDTVDQLLVAPDSLLSEILTNFGRHPVIDCEKFNSNPKSRRELRQKILDGVNTHGRMFRWLMREQPWDVLLTVFAAPHCTGHHYWQYMDPSYPGYDDGNAEGLGDTIERAYRAIDREIDEMISAAGDDTRVFVFAGHGMGPLRHASWNLNQILDLLGFNGASPGVRAHVDRPARINPWRILKMTAPSRLQYRIKDMLPKSLQDYLLFLWYAGGRRYKGKRVFAVPNNDNAGAIRISVGGRDRGGLVQPGAEYERLCGEITEALQELTDPVSGRPVVKCVAQPQKKYAGPYVDKLPDITVLWDNSFPWTSLQSPRFGTLHLRRQDARSGSHTPHGFLLAVGPGIPAGVELEGASIYDIAPTVLEGAGVAVPDHFDGRPIRLPISSGVAGSRSLTH